MKRIRIRQFGDRWFLWTRPFLFWEKHDHACYKSPEKAFAAGENILAADKRNRYIGKFLYR